MEPVALVTGGRQGIGRAIVEHFLQHGWRVAACGLHPDPSSPATMYQTCDVGDRKQVNAWVAAVAERLGPFTAVVNNAGLGGSNPVGGEDDDKTWQRIIATNLNGTYHVCSASLPHLADGGSIINLGSVLAHQGVADATAYCAAKHAVVGYSRALAKALAAKSITVNVVSPGWVDTEMAAARFRELAITSARAVAAVPQRRMITCQEVAATVYFLTTPGARGITGQSVVVDGGYLA